MRLPAWLRAREGGSRLNGDVPDAPLPDHPQTDPRTAADLGDALIAYWRNGGWFGFDSFITWLIDHGHVSEAAYALQTIRAVPRDEEKEKKVRQRMRAPENKLVAWRREALPPLPDRAPRVSDDPPGSVQAL